MKRDKPKPPVVAVPVYGLWELMKDNPTFKIERAFDGTRSYTFPPDAIVSEIVPFVRKAEEIIREQYFYIRDNKVPIPLQKSMPMCPPPYSKVIISEERHQKRVDRGTRDAERTPHRKKYSFKNQRTVRKELNRGGKAGDAFDRARRIVPGLTRAGFKALARKKAVKD